MQQSAKTLATVALASIGCCLVACTDSAPVAAETPSSCVADGAVTAEIYGGLRVSIDWAAADLECEGMPRPAGAGARLRFAGMAGEADRSRKLAFILGLPGLRQGETASELPTNVTVMEEGAGRFFGTRGANGCWTDIETHERLSQSDYRISGVVYCVAPLANLNGNSSISFAELEFTGRLNWDSP